MKFSQTNHEYLDLFLKQTTFDDKWGPTEVFNHLRANCRYSLLDRNQQFICSLSEEFCQPENCPVMLK